MHLKAVIHTRSPRLRLDVGEKQSCRPASRSAAMPSPPKKGETFASNLHLGCLSFGTFRCNKNGMCGTDSHVHHLMRHPGLRASRTVFKSALHLKAATCKLQAENNFLTFKIEQRADRLAGRTRPVRLDTGFGHAFYHIADSSSSRRSTLIHIFIQTCVVFVFRGCWSNLGA